MSISGTHSLETLWIGLLLLAFLITGCAGMDPYVPRDDREEGPEKGLFSGTDGEFVIYRKPAEPADEKAINK